MNSLAAKFFTVLIAGVLVYCVILNQKIKKEISLKPKQSDAVVHKTVPEEPARASGPEYDMNSDYPTLPAARDDVQPVPPKPERVPDKNIIYEMPITNKFLVQ